MDSVLDFLFLRRLKFDYISPPVCPFPIASASGLSIPVQTICPLVCPDAPRVVNNEFVVWNIEPLPGVCCTDVVCFNLYQQIGGSFVTVNECQPVNSLVVCSAGSWEISAILTTGDENPPVGPFVSDGVNKLTITLPFVEGIAQYRIKKDGHTVGMAMFSGGIEICNDACYAVSQITSDGETCLSAITCVTIPPPPPLVDSLNDVVSYWKLDETSGTRFDSVSSNNLDDVFGNIPSTSGIIDKSANFASLFPGQALQTIADPPNVFLGPGRSISISIWVQNNGNLTGSRSIIVKSGTGSPPDEWVLSHDNTLGFVSFFVRMGIGGFTFVNSGPPDIMLDPPGTIWRHIACGFDHVSQTVWMQFDGGPRISNPCSDGVHSTQPIVIGNYPPFNNFTSSANYDECGIWNRVLTEAEVARLYNGGAGYALSNFYP